MVGGGLGSAYSKKLIVASYKTGFLLRKSFKDN